MQDTPEPAEETPPNTEKPGQVRRRKRDYHGTKKAPNSQRPLTTDQQSKPPPPAQPAPPSS